MFINITKAKTSDEIRLDLEWARNPVTGGLRRKGRRASGTHAQEEDHVETEAEAGVTQPHAKGHLEPPEFGRANKNSTLEPSEGAWTCQYSDFRLWPSEP